MATQGLGAGLTGFMQGAFDAMKMYMAYEQMKSQQANQQFEQDYKSKLFDLTKAEKDALINKYNAEAEQKSKLFTRPLTIEEKTQYGFKPDDAVWFDNDGNIKTVPKGTNINVNTGEMLGKPEPGYMYKMQDDGSIVAVPIPGSPAATKLQEIQTKKESAQESRKLKAGVLLEDIDRTLNIVNESPITTTGIGGWTLSNIPGTRAKDVDNLLTGIKSKIGFDTLQEMRANSPTGGALGAVSEKENELLQSAYGSLAQSSSKEQFEYNLKRLANIYKDIVYGTPEYLQQMYKQGKIDEKTYRIASQRYKLADETAQPDKSFSDTQQKSNHPLEKYLIGR